MGMAASMGAGMLLLSGGVASVTGLPSGPISLAIVAGTWLVVGVFSALPYMFFGLGPIDAVFEATSAILPQAPVERDHQVLRRVVTEGSPSRVRTTRSRRLDAVVGRH